MNDAALSERATVVEIMEATGGPLPAVADPPERPVGVVASPEGYATLMHIIERAANNPVLDLDRIEKLLDIKTQWEERQAEKAYYEAFAAFQGDPPIVVKNKHVVIAHKDGNGTIEYWHATLDECVGKITPALSRHSLSHRWDVAYLDGGLIKVTCTLRHCLGHFETVSMQAGRDTSGQKNTLQEQQSTVTYLERYTLLAITGLAAAGTDDDGMSAEEREQSDKTLRIASDQKETLVGLQIAAGANAERFLIHFKIASLDELPQYRFDEAKKLLEDKLERKKAGAAQQPSLQAR